VEFWKEQKEFERVLLFWSLFPTHLLKKQESWALNVINDPGIALHWVLT